LAPAGHPLLELVNPQAMVAGTPAACGLTVLKKSRTWLGDHVRFFYFGSDLLSVLD
jgi:hypothetical protein